MKLQVELISCLAYDDKKTKEPKTRIGYRLISPEYRQNTKTLKGYSELSAYIPGHDVFNRMKPEYFGVAAELDGEEVISPSNPTRKILKLKSVKIGNDNISLL